MVGTVTEGTADAVAVTGGGNVTEERGTGDAVAVTVGKTVETGDGENGGGVTGEGIGDADAGDSFVGSAGTLDFGEGEETGGGLDLSGTGDAMYGRFEEKMVTSVALTTPRANTVQMRV